MSAKQLRPGFEAFFHDALGQDPFEFQGRFARELPSLIHVPTGLGKTAMAVVGWLWRRFGAGDEVRCRTPRRLVYCLPMRVLVEQTRDNAVLWLNNLNRLAGKATFDIEDGKKRLRSYTPDFGASDRVPIQVLMGGADENDWDIHPEREAIIIGTQDMLLSRALNRGYAASRSRWPMQFGFLHTDCLWVFDEIQLMGSGLATTAQLEAFRYLLPRNDAEVAKNGHGCRSVWMSATLRPDWLGTVDFKDRIDEQGRIDGKETLSLTKEDHENEQVRNRWSAKKPLAKATSAMDAPAKLAKELRDAHKPGTRTIVVVNTVKRACELYKALEDEMNDASAAGARSGKRSRRKRNEPVHAEPNAGTNTPRPNLVLLNSRFRPADRAKRVEEALADISTGDPGTIVVSTQVIEVGVDVSAATLFTELAPWASLVQRFGRCNRRGEEDDHASVRWIDLPAKAADAEKASLPYELADLRAAAAQLKELGDVGLGSLATHREKLSKTEEAALFPHEHTHVIRRRDLIDLFDTTPDLAGNDIDIDRFVREIEESDVRVFWRAWDRPKGHEPPPKDEPAPRREELCPAPVGEFRDFAKKHGGQVWRWNFLKETWDKVDLDKVDTAKVAPGQVFLVHADAGGYSAKTGWSLGSKARVDPIALPSGTAGETLDGTDSDRLSRVGVWQTIAEHTDQVCRELGAIVDALALADGQANVLRKAARYHDWGKAHRTFIAALPEGAPDAAKHWAKAAGQWKRYERRHFRHELASALAVLQRSHDHLKRLSDDDLNLVAYLIAAHHGKVRQSIRSLPNELRPRDADGKPEPQKRFARGVWDGDALPATDLGGGVTAPAVTLSLEPVELGLCERPPFEGQPSWAERMIHLRDAVGLFRLAYLETLLRAADIRASKAAEQRATAGDHAGTGADTE